MTSWLSSALTPLQWILLAAIPPAIVLLYFLKLKRMPLEVPSTYLWSRTIEDLHVNSIWQRLRQSLLLLLQLLLIALIMLALLRPGWRSSRLTGNRFIFLIDNSASMSATDVAPNRLEEAKRLAGQMIDQMKYGEEATVMTFSDQARIGRAFTDNRRQLQSLVREILPTNRTTDISDALRVAASQANTGRTGDPNNPQDEKVAEARPTTLYIYSDGGMPPVGDVTLANIEIRYIPIGSSIPSNLAITAFSVDRNPERANELQAFARIENFGDRDRECRAELFLDGKSLDVQTVQAAAGDGTGLQFQLRDIEQGELKLVLDLDDDLELDNQAFTAVDPPRPARVLFVSPGNEGLRRALATDVAAKLADVSFADVDVLQTPAYADDADLGRYDLVIYDQCVPPKMPQANTLFIGRAPPLETWSLGERTGPPAILDVDRSHPLMQLLELGNVRIVEASAVKSPPAAISLIDSTIGTLMSIAERGAFQDAVLGFDFLMRDEKGELVPNTDWQRYYSFPIFVQNLLSYLGGAGSATTANSVLPGQPIRLRSAGNVGALEIRSPAGEESVLKREGGSGFIFSGTDLQGIYAVRESGQKVASQHFAVNLFQALESNLLPAEKLDIGSTEIRKEAVSEVTRRELWKLILGLALVVLLFEWYVYNRRVYL
ncbi:MAG: hypothetical protein RIS70_3774 [Planctomycetota bacterium]